MADTPDVIALRDLVGKAGQMAEDLVAFEDAAWMPPQLRADVNRFYDVAQSLELSCADALGRDKPDTLPLPLGPAYG